MKNFRLIIAVFIFASSLSVIVSCNKSDDKTTATTLVAKWNVSSMKFRTVVTDTSDTTANIPIATTDYIDFRTNGKVYINLSAFHSVDTDVYVIIGSKVITGDTTGGDIPDTFAIQNLTTSSVSLYKKQIKSNGFEEQTLNLSK